MLTVLAVTILLCLAPCAIGKFINEMETLDGRADRADPQAQMVSTLECR